MPDSSSPTSWHPVPADDPGRNLTLAKPNQDETLPHVSVAGETVNVPANAPHAFVNASGLPARRLCLCAPAGQDEFVMAIGDPVASRTALPSAIGKAAQAERIENAKALAPRFGTELLIP